MGPEVAFVFKLAILFQRMHYLKSKQDTCNVKFTKQPHIVPNKHQYSKQIEVKTSTSTLGRSRPRLAPVFQDNIVEAKPSRSLGTVPFLFKKCLGQVKVNLCQTNDCKSNNDTKMYELSSLLMR